MRRPIMKGTNLIFVVVLLAAIFILSADVGYSCTCIQISHQKEFRLADAIFTGQVIDVSEDKSFVPPTLDPKVASDSPIRKIVESQKQYIVTVKVDRKFKGVKGKDVSFYSTQSDSPCSGLLFSVGNSYLIYAKRHDQKLRGGGLCDRTRRLDMSDKDYKELNSFWFRLRGRMPRLF